MTDTNEMNYQIKGQVRMDEGDRILGDAAELDRLLALINTRFSRRELTNEELGLNIGDDDPTQEEISASVVDKMEGPEIKMGPCHAG